MHYLRAQKVRKVFIRKMTDLHKSVDVFLTPGRPTLPSIPDKSRQNFSRPWNVCGFPAIVLPAGFSSDPAGLPLALQLGARPFEEELLYAAAYAYEAETKWWEKKKPAV